MPTISDLNMMFSGPVLGLFLLFVFIIAFSIFIYRKTNPIIPKIYKFVLVFLRTLSLLLLLLVIYEAVFEQNRTSSQQPILAVAIDNSASMSIADNSGDRAEQVVKILESEWLHSNSNVFDIKYFVFSDQMQPINSAEKDSLTFLGDKTDITKSLKSIKEKLNTENLTDILLISDGNYNSGTSPLRVAENFNIPIHTLGIGSTEPVSDLSIIKVDFNDFTYVNDSTPITISIRNIGFDRGQATLSAVVNGGPLFSQALKIDPSPSEFEHTFYYKPTTEGQKKIELNLTTGNNEQTLENNKKTIYINVLKSKLKITALSGSASPEISFLKRSLSSNKRYELEWALQNNNNGYFNPQPEKDFINNADIFILIDFPTSNTAFNLMEKIRAKVQKDKTPILLLFGKNISSQKISILQKHLPFRSNYKSGPERSKVVKMSQIGALHSIMKFTSSSSHPADFTIEQLPPIFTSLVNVTHWPNAETLAFLKNLNKNSKTQTKNTGPPFLSIRVDGAQKSATIFAYGLWRWSLLMANRSNDVDYYSQLFGHLLRWLEPDNSPEGTSLTLNKNKFSLADKIEATIKARDSQNQPISDVEIILKVNSNNSERLKKVVKSKEGTFLSDFLVDQPGDYKITAEIYSHGNLLETVHSQFTVGEYSAELSQTALQRLLLTNLSETTGGTYFSADSLSPLEEKLYGPKRTLIRTSHLNIWNNMIVLAVIILLLVTEWYIRKRLGLT
jgi:hypothetical protein